MQIFRAKLSKVVSEPELWAAWQQMGFADVVAWNFDDLVVEARIERALPWDPANFKQTFSMAIHRVCSTCTITWL